MAVVYQATNLINGKRYIGVTTMPLSHRKNSHHSVARRGAKTLIHAALRKYGFDGFKWEVLHDYLFTEHAQEAEVRLIKSLKPEYNIVATYNGVLGLKHTPEVRAKVLAFWTKEKRAEWAKYGKRLHTGDIQKRGADTRRGKPLLSRRGYKHTPEAISLMQSAAKKRSKGSWAEAHRKSSEVLSRPVMCLTDGKTYKSLTEAAVAYNTNSASIGRVCNGTRKKHHGMVFKFIEKASK